QVHMHSLNAQAQEVHLIGLPSITYPMTSLKRNYRFFMFNSVAFLLIWMMLSGGCKKNDGKESPPPPPDPPATTDVVFYITQGDQFTLFKKQNVSLVFSGNGTAGTTIEVD